MTPKPEQRLRADAARNRELVLRIAREQLAAGNDALQLNTIARLAGVGVGTVYRHFPTQQALLEALSTERLEQLVRAVQDAADDADPVEGLHRMVRFTVGRALEDNGFVAVLESSDATESATAEMKAQLDEAVTRLLARAAGAVRKDIQADDIRRLVCGVVHAVQAGGDPDLYVAVLIRGLSG